MSRVSPIVEFCYDHFFRQVESPVTQDRRKACLLARVGPGGRSASPQQPLKHSATLQRGLFS